MTYRLVLSLDIDVHVVWVSWYSEPRWYLEKKSVSWTSCPRGRRSSKIERARKMSRSVLFLFPASFLPSFLPLSSWKNHWKRCWEVILLAQFFRGVEGRVNQTRNVDFENLIAPYENEKWPDRQEAMWHTTNGMYAYRKGSGWVQMPQCSLLSLYVFYPHPFPFQQTSIHTKANTNTWVYKKTEH